jgi:chemotaxis methyl-accepting protein methylase
MEEFSNIHVNDHNKNKFRELFNNYAKENNIKETPVLNKNISDKILKDFYSKFTSELWQQPYVDHFLDAVTPKLNKICSDEIRILVMGCGNGHEAYSIYFLLNNDFKDAVIKMIAADMNLNAISSASRFEINSKMIPSWVNKDKYFFSASSDVYKVKKEISDKIFFEFHNAQNISTYKKEFDIVIARDMSLSLSEAEYLRFMNDMIPKITSGGIYIIGDNEELSHPELTKVSAKDISIYIKK